MPQAERQRTIASGPTARDGHQPPPSVVNSLNFRSHVRTAGQEFGRTDAAQMPLGLGAQRQFVLWFLLRFADYCEKGRLYIRYAVRPSQLLGSVDTSIESICQDVTKELGVPFMHPHTNRTHCLLHSHLIDTVRILPTEITTMHLLPVVNISLQNGRAGDRLDVIPVNSIHSAIFRDMCCTPSERKQNVNLEYLHCQCGEYHIHVTLTEHVEVILYQRQSFNF